MADDKDSAVPDSAMLEALQKDADIPHLPTQETYQFRMAVSGQGPLAYQWSDKPHRLLYDACSIIEAQAAEIKRHEAFAQEVGDAVVKAIRFCKDGRPASAAGAIGAFVIPAPNPDPLVEVLKKLNWYDAETEAADLRAALDAAGFEIREKNDG